MAGGLSFIIKGKRSLTIFGDLRFSLSVDFHHYEREMTDHGWRSLFLHYTGEMTDHGWRSLLYHHKEEMIDHGWRSLVHHTKKGK